MGFESFADLSALFASSMNNLMRQSIIQCTSGTRPSSPVEGMMIAETDTDRLLVYDGSAWRRVAHFGSAGRTQVRLRRAANQSIASATLTDISWDTEDSDTDGFITATGTTLTVPSGLGGLYAITASATPAANTGVPAMLITAGGNIYQFIGGNFVAAITYSAAALVQLAAADTVKVSVIYSAAGPINHTARLEMYRVGL